MWIPPEAWLGLTLGERAELYGAAKRKRGK
jgi:hypothetical protein